MICSCWAFYVLKKLKGPHLNTPNTSNRFAVLRSFKGRNFKNPVRTDWKAAISYKELMKNHLTWSVLNNDFNCFYYNVHYNDNANTL